MATFTVNSIADATADDGDTTLREALALADANAGADTIEFDASLAGQTITLGGSELILSSDVTIDGDVDGDNKADITVSGNNASRVFNATAGTSALDSLTITSGQAAQGQSGGGLYVGNSATVTITASTLTGNRAGNGANGIQGSDADYFGSVPGSDGTHGGAGGAGGAAFVAGGGALNVISSSLIGNAAGSGGQGGNGGNGVELFPGSFYYNAGNGGQGGTGGDGGGLFAASGGSLSILNTTLSGNASGSAGNGGSGGYTGPRYTSGYGGASGTAGMGGGISGHGSLTIANSTITGNNGGVAAFGTASLTNSIVLGNTGGDVSGVGTVTASVTSGDASTIFANVSGGAGVLADNGGPVQTIALRADSSNVALDIGTSTLATDAAGNARSVDQAGINNGGTVDAGALELALLDTTGPTVSALSPTDNATGIAVDANLIITFDENVQKGTGNITIHLASDDSVVETIDVASAAVTVADSTVTVNPASDLASASDYYVLIAATAFDDLAGNSYAGIADATIFNFATGETPSLIVTIASDTVNDRDGETSLREAIAFANSNADQSDITFDASLAGQIITLGGSELTLSSDVSIDGDTDGDGVADITISGNNSSRVFNASAGSSTIDALNITGGNGSGGNGGGLHIGTGTTVTVRATTISGNHAQDGADQLGNHGSDGTDGRHGGGVSVAPGGILYTIDSAIVGNSAGSGGNGSSDTEGFGGDGGNGGDGGHGGGIYVENGATLEAVNTTIANNTAGSAGTGGLGSFNYGGDNGSNGVSGSVGQGGGVAGGGTLNILQTTITGNNASSVGGISATGTATLTNSIVLGNGGGEVSGIDTNTASITSGDSATVFRDVNGNAGQLGDNGGPVQTVALRAVGFNPAVDIAATNVDATTDAAGMARFDQSLVNNGGIADAGALEVSPEFEASSLVVTIATDTVDAFDNETSLREAIAYANSNADASTITFAAALDGSTITLGGSELILSTDMTIDGDTDGDEKANITVSGDNASRVFNALAGTSTLESLTITGGNGTHGNGGGIHVGNATTLTLKSSTLTGNSVDDGTSGSYGRDGGDGKHGGGASVAAGGVLNVLGSAIVGNSAGNGGDGGDSYHWYAGDGGDAGRGGGVYIESGATFNATNTTFANNYAGAAGSGGESTSIINFRDYSGSDGNAGAGGGVAGGGALNIINSTFTGNSAETSGGIAATGNAGIVNSIVLGNIGGEATGVSTTASITSGDASLVFANVNNGAGQLADNGGSVQSVALKVDAANPALDIGTLPAGITTDVAGNSRNVDLSDVDHGGTVDAGALELALIPETPSLVVTIATDTVNNTDNETSLREAIALANSNADQSDITFDASLAGQTITLSGSELVLSSNLSIDGDTDGDGDADITISGDNASRVFNANGGTSTLHKLKITGGNGGGGNGGGLYIDNGATVTLQASTLFNNSAAGGIDGISGGAYQDGGNGTDGFNGGGAFIAGGGSLNLVNSSIFDNSAGDGGRGGNGGSSPFLASNGGNGGNAGSGGGLFADSGAILTVVNTTIANNDAGSGGSLGNAGDAFLIGGIGRLGSSGNVGSGGGIAGGGTISIVNSTLTGNSAGSGTFNLFSQDNIAGNWGGIAATGTASLTNSIVLGNMHGDLNGVDTVTASITSGDVATVFDTLNGDAGALADNGGPVMTVSLKADVSNPALDIGAVEAGLASDVAGSSRSVDLLGIDNGGTVDAGALELSQSAVPIILTGNADNETISGGDLEDSINGGVGKDLVNGGGGDDSLVGADGDDRLRGGTGSDTLHGDEGADDLRGNDGNDSINGGEGDDLVFGGTGEDVIEGGDGEDRLNGNAGNDSILGGDGKDLIFGGSDDDTIDGGRGDDIIGGQSGDDVLRGGGGADTIYGGSGVDSIWGASGDDLIFGSKNDAGTEILRGGQGNDSIFGNSGVDHLFGNGDSDFLSGGAGNDELFGGTGDDTLLGNDGDDFLNGLGDNDFLNGGAGSDTLLGSIGNDRLNGGEGDDELSGGVGADIFIFADGFSDLRDTITDFEDGIDRLNFLNVTGFTEVSDLTISDTSVDGTAGATIMFAGNEVFLEGIATADISNDDFLFT